MKYESPSGYKTKNEKISTAPYFGMSSDRFSPFHFGISLYGSVGTGFDYDGDKSYGINHDFTSTMGNMYLNHPQDRLEFAFDASNTKMIFVFTRAC